MRRGLALTLALCLSLTGCAGRALPRPTDIASLKLVRTMGLDRMPTGGVKLTVWGDVERDGSGGETQPPFHDAAPGESLFTAAAALDGKGEGRLEYGHTEECVIGEALAQEGLAPVTDYLERDGSVRTGTKLFLVRGGTAEEALTAAAGEDSAPTRRLTAFSQNPGLGGDHWPFLLRRFLEDTGDNGAALLPVLTAEGGELSLSGLGWTREQRLGGYFTREESRGIALLLGLNQQDAFLLATDRGQAGVRLVKSRCRWEPVREGGEIVGLVARVTLYGKVTQLPPGLDLNELGDRRLLEEQWLAQGKHLCVQGAAAVMETGLDLLHLERGLTARHPLMAQALETAFRTGQWRNIRVEVQGTLGRTYDTDRPLGREEDVR